MTTPNTPFAIRARIAAIVIARRYPTMSSDEVNRRAAEMVPMTEQSAQWEIMNPETATFHSRGINRI